MRYIKIQVEYNYRENIRSAGEEREKNKITIITVVYNIAWKNINGELVEEDNRTLWKDPKLWVTQIYIRYIFFTYILWDGTFYPSSDQKQFR